MNIAPLRVVFMGTPSFAVPSLQALLADDRFEVAAIWTQPDRPAGRGQQMMPSPVKICAEAAGIPIYQPEKLSTADTEQMQQLAPDFLVVVAYGQLLAQEILDVPVVAPINIHFSLLPAWRGAAPIQPAIFNDGLGFGVSFARMERGLDSGPVYLARPMPLPLDKTAFELYTQLAEQSAQELPDVLQQIAADELTAQPQIGESSFAPKITKADGQIDWHADTAELLEKKLRAYSPWPGLFTFAAGKRLKILDFKIAPASIAEPGQVFWQDDTVCVAAADGTAIELKKVQPAGKQAMAAADWLRGDTAIIGSKLG